jgi:tripartite-type tricarboxylate transporter receptor subunit TctC
VARLSAAAIDAMRAATVRSRLESLGVEPTGLGAGELAAIMKRDYEHWGPVIKASGFKAEN